MPKSMKDDSLLIIHSDRADLFSEVLRFCGDWANAIGLRAYVRNTPEGYEIFTVKPPSDEAAPQASALPHQFRPKTANDMLTYFSPLNETVMTASLPLRNGFSAGPMCHRSIWT